jgi:hypothetical protein
MPLPVTVGLIVLAVMTIVGVTAHLIDESTERQERTRDDGDA